MSRIGRRLAEENARPIFDPKRIPLPTPATPAPQKTEPVKVPTRVGQKMGRDLTQLTLTVARTLGIGEEVAAAKLLQIVERIREALTLAANKPKPKPTRKRPY